MCLKKVWNATIWENKVKRSRGLKEISMILDSTLGKQNHDSGKKTTFEKERKRPVSLSDVTPSKT